MIKKYLHRFLARTSKKQLSLEDISFRKDLNRIIGYQVKNLDLYYEAFALKNIATRDQAKDKNYERLEFLGDAILGAVISASLFKIYPDANEGYLTQMKSKIVNRKNLNKLGERLSILEFAATPENQNLSNNIEGNLFEALVGAVYLDLGYDICEQVIIEKLFTLEDINKLENKIVSYKSLLLEWSQKTKHNIQFDTFKESQPKAQSMFRCNIILDGEKIANAAASSKKKAEEKASQRAFYVLNKKENLLENTKNIA